MPDSRVEILALLAGQRPARLPVFGGLPSLTSAGLAAVGLTYTQAHRTASAMAEAAASTAETFGYESVVVPHDMCVEAEALGAQVDFHEGAGGFSAPIVTRPLSSLTEPPLLAAPAAIEAAGRVAMVGDAIRRLKAGIGRHAAVGAWVPGPFTLGWQLYGLEAWMEVVTDPAALGPRLEKMAGVLQQVAQVYHLAGADYLTVHEMGGSPQVVGPRVFRRSIKPALTQLIERLPGPVVLSVCGDTNAVIADLAACGAAALNLDHRNDLARTRQQLGAEPILLGNFDPVGVLSQGTPAQVADTVQNIAAAGADAVWPGCDLWPEIPEANFRALMQAAAGITR